MKSSFGIFTIKNPYYHTLKLESGRADVEDYGYCTLRLDFDIVIREFAVKVANPGVTVAFILLSSDLSTVPIDLGVWCSMRHKIKIAEGETFGMRAYGPNANALEIVMRCDKSKQYPK